MLLPFTSDAPYTCEGEEYVFSLSVCGGAETPVCNEKDAAVCQVKKADSTQAKVAGRLQNQTLRWVRPSGNLEAHPVRSRES